MLDTCQFEPQLLHKTLWYHQINTEHIRNLSIFEDMLKWHIDAVHNKVQSKALDERAPDAPAVYCFVNIWTGLTGDLADMC